jgi:hypothetical protein
MGNCKVRETGFIVSTDIVVIRLFSVISVLTE